MAEIPVEKKSGIPGWLWALLALLLIALVAWWLLDDDGNDIVEYNDDNAVVEQSVNADGDADVVAATAWAIGDSVDLDNVRVTSLAGDMAFNADVNGENMLVLFDQERTPGDATEGEYDINSGSIVNLEGEVRSASDPLPAGVSASIPAGTERYIYATAIEMVN